MVRSSFVLPFTSASVRTNADQWVSTDPHCVRNLEDCDRQFAVTGECEHVSFVFSAQVPFGSMCTGID